MTTSRICIRTNAEKRLAEVLRKRKIIFEQNKTIEGFEIDFWFPQYRLAVEVDGYTHLSIFQQQLDQGKDQMLIEKGIILLRITNQQVRNNLPLCLLEIEAVIEQLKSMTKRNSINDQWKDCLKKLVLEQEKPRKVIKTVEDYFLSLEDK